MGQPQPSYRQGDMPGFPANASAIASLTGDVNAPDGANGAAYVYVGVTGDVAVVPAGGQGPVTFKAVPAGQPVPCLVATVKSTGNGTTASSLVWVW